MYEQKQLPGMETGSFIYVGLRNGFAKIGMSNDPARRARQLKLTLMVVLPGGRLEEKWLHQRFADARQDREWFILTPSLLQFIADHATARWGQRSALRVS